MIPTFICLCAAPLSLFPLPKLPLQLPAVQLPSFTGGSTFPTLPVFPTFNTPTLRWPALPRSAVWPAVVPVGWPTLEWSASAADTPAPVVIEDPGSAPAGFVIATIISICLRLVGQVGLVFLIAVAGLQAAGLLPGLLVHAKVAGLLATPQTAVLAGAAAVWLGLEGAFYGACLVLANRMTRDKSFAKPALDSARRQELWARILSDPTQSTEDFVRAWFFVDRGPERVRHGGARSALWGWARAALGVEDPPPAKGEVSYAQLSRIDVLTWLAGGLFEKPLAQLDAEEAAELDGLVAQLEAKAGAPLPRVRKTPTPGVRAMMSSIDPVQWLHRPVACYALTHLLFGEIITPRIFSNAGFTRRRTPKEGMVYYVRGAGSGTSSSVGGAVRVPPAWEQYMGGGSVVMGGGSGGPAAAAAATRAAAALSSGASTRATALSSRPAFVFIHGVGVGPGPYAGLLEKIALVGVDPEERGAAEGAVTGVNPVEPLCFALQVDHFAARIAPGRPASPRAFAKEYERLLDSYGVESAVVIGHSLGTGYASYLSRFAPRRVAAIALIDPICCMLHHARTTRAFVYQPVGPSVKVACEEYYVRRELFTANVIARHFRWHEATLWPSECTPQTPHLIVLSEEDQIVPVQALRSCATTWNARARGVQVLSLTGLGHGGWLGDSAASGEIARRVRGLARRRFALPSLPTLPELPTSLPPFSGLASSAASAVAALPRTALPSLPTPASFDLESFAFDLPDPGAAAARAAAAASAAASAALPAPRFFVTRDRLLETAARAGVEQKAAEQLWGLLVAGDGGDGFGVAPQPPRVQFEGADAENKDEDI